MSPAEDDLLSNFEDIIVQENQHLQDLTELNFQRQLYHIYSVLATAVFQFSQNSDCDHLHEIIKDDISTKVMKIRNYVLSSNIEPLIDELEGLQSYEFDKPSHQEKCQEEWLFFIDLIERQKHNIQSLISKKPSFDRSMSNQSVVDLYSQIIDPLSNIKRLEILVAIDNNAHRFKDLEKALDLQAGHLIYHLNPLKESGFVVQDEDKNYLLSNRGKVVLHGLKRIYSDF